MNLAELALSFAVAMFVSWASVLFFWNHSCKEEKTM